MMFSMERRRREQWGLTQPIAAHGVRGAERKKGEGESDEEKIEHNAPPSGTEERWLADNRRRSGQSIEHDRAAA